MAPLYSNSRYLRAAVVSPRNVVAMISLWDYFVKLFRCSTSLFSCPAHLLLSPKVGQHGAAKYQVYFIFRVACVALNSSMVALYDQQSTYLVYTFGFVESHRAALISHDFIGQLTIGQLVALYNQQYLRVECLRPPSPFIMYVPSRGKGRPRYRQEREVVHICTLIVRSYFSTVTPHCSRTKTAESEPAIPPNEVKDGDGIEVCIITSI